MIPDRPAIARGGGALCDAIGRELHYLRLSVTERCNFRCEYCAPDGCSLPSAETPLTLAEIGRLFDAFAALGFWKVRLTGGEPTLRRDLLDVVRRAAATPGIRRVGLSTNGVRLSDLAAPLRGAGLATINVSLDSLHPDRFRRITGADGLQRVLAGIDAALAAGFPAVKLNVVLLRDLDDGEIDAFLAWTERAPLTIRFIELMETGANRPVFDRAHLSAERLRQKLLREGWTALPRDGQDGPAVAFARAGHAGQVGLIAAYGHAFCATCNRLRVSAAGELRLCLYGHELVPLRPLLERDEDRDALVALVRAAVQRKPASHQLAERACGANRTMAAIGG